jgi:hypothetical protein
MATSDKVHTTIGVYPNGDKVINGVKIDHLPTHIAYNLFHRPGRAFWLNGVLLHKGALSEEQLDHYTKLFNSDSQYTRTSFDEKYR